MLFTGTAPLKRPGRATQTAECVSERMRNHRPELWALPHACAAYALLGSVRREFHSGGGVNEL